jgi:indolepyruvate ferredoxin oxidoreductase
LPLLDALISPGHIIEFKKRPQLEDLIQQRVRFLTAYQNTAYASVYENFVKTVKAKDLYTDGDSIMEFGYDPQI